MMRRTLLGSLVGSLVVAATVIGAAPAAAANQTVVSRFGVPAPLTFSPVSSGCGAGPFVATTHHIKGPGAPPLGTGKLQIGVGAKSAANLGADLSASNIPLGGLTALSLSVYVPKGSGTMTNLLNVRTGPNGSNDYFTLITEVTGTVNQWKPFDALNSDVNFTWTEFNQSDTQIDTGTSTYSAFATSHSNLTLDTLGLTSTNCATSTQRLDIDKLSLGLNSSTTTMNFEAPIATQLTSHTSKQLVGYHKAVTPTAKLTTGGKPLKNQLVSLWQKPAGAKNYRHIASITTNAKGGATGPVQRPKLNTTYLWRFSANRKHGLGASVSKPDPVAVHSKVRLDLERRSVPHNEPIAGGGSVTPRHAGLKVTLWSRTVTGTGKHQKLGKAVKVASTKLRRDGTYTVSGSLAPGTYKVFTTAAADAHNAAGHSTARKFVVRA